MDKLIHFLIPRESNNHKAKLLHPSSLITLAVLMLIFQSLINYVPSLKPNILGYAAQISPSDVIRITNVKRSAVGLSPLSLNQTLSNAAYTKGRDMIDRDYWAHVAPDGTQPWKFFKDFDYKYRYAGENLARDFSSASNVVDAWMSSPTHKENILNPKYKEIGIGVVEGDLAGSDTTIVVQFFGTKSVDTIAQPLADNGVKTLVETSEQPEKKEVAEEPSKLTVIPEVKSEITTQEQDQKVLISPFSTTKNTSIIVVALLLAVFVIDAILVSRRKITRIAGRTFSHIIFLSMVLVIIIILKSGKLI